MSGKEKTMPPKADPLTAQHVPPVHTPALLSPPQSCIKQREINAWGCLLVLRIAHSHRHSTATPAIGTSKKTLRDRKRKREYAHAVLYGGVIVPKANARAQRLLLELTQQSSHGAARAAPNPLVGRVGGAVLISGSVDLSKNKKPQPCLLRSNSREAPRQCFWYSSPRAWKRRAGRQCREGAWRGSDEWFSRHPLPPLHRSCPSLPLHWWPQAETCRNDGKQGSLKQRVEAVQMQHASQPAFTYRSQSRSLTARLPRAMSETTGGRLTTGATLCM